MTSLDLALIGNGTIGCLVDPRAAIVWGCFPRFDGDPAFCSLLREHASDECLGSFAVDLVDHVRDEQEYLPNTPILVTRLYDGSGGCIEVRDFAPRFRQHERMFCPMMVVRQIRRVAGTPRVRVRLCPAYDYGGHSSSTTSGSNHIRYLSPGLVMRLTTDASITALLEETPFFLDDAITLILGPDETVQGSVAEVGRHFFEETADYWRGWVRHLAIPFEWQDAVIRAAISLELNVFEDTGAIIAAVTTSIPEARDSARNWDYRYCWLRDAYFVVNALNRLGATRTMERHLGYVLNVVAGASGGRLGRCTTSAGARPLMSARCIPCPAIAGWVRCESAIKPSSRSSTTSMARPFWRRPTCSSTSGWTSAATRCCSVASRRSASGPRCCSTSRTPACGNCAG